MLGNVILIRIIAFTIVTLTNEPTNKQTNKTFILSLALQALHYGYKEIILMLPNME